MDEETQAADLRPLLHHQVHRPRARAGGRARHRARPPRRASSSTARRAGTTLPGPLPGRRPRAGRGASRRRPQRGRAGRAAAGHRAGGGRRGERARGLPGDAGALRLPCSRPPDGEEALELFRARAGEIALVILDLTMPGMDGEEALAEMRRIDPDVEGASSRAATTSRPPAASPGRGPPASCRSRTAWTGCARRWRRRWGVPSGRRAGSELRGGPGRKRRRRAAVYPGGIADRSRRGPGRPGAS